MGSGKTTCGRLLAKALNLAFVDLDSQMEQEHNQTVSELMEQKGLEAFRFLERAQLQEVLKKDSQVISLGGGALIDPQNQKEVLKNSRLVYLKHSPEILFQRSMELEGRPLLQGVDSMGWKHLFQEREPGYLKAPIILNCDSKSFQEIVEGLVHVFKEVL